MKIHINIIVFISHNSHAVFMYHISSLTRKYVSNFEKYINTKIQFSDLRKICYNFKNYYYFFNLQLFQLNKTDFKFMKCVKKHIQTIC